MKNLILKKGLPAERSLRPFFFFLLNPDKEEADLRSIHPLRSPSNQISVSLSLSSLDMLTGSG